MKKEFFIMVGYTYEDEPFNNMIVVDIVDTEEEAREIANEYEQREDVDIVNIYEATKIY